MKRLLILTKRNCDDAMRFAQHVQGQPDWGVRIDTSNINDWPHYPGYGITIDSIDQFDLIWMYYYPHIVKPETLEENSRWLNTHPSYLPFNRGSAPNFFSIVTGTPAGVSVHKVVKELDRGKILARSEVECKPDWTGETLYWKLQAEALELTIEVFDKIKDSTDVDYVWNELGTDQQKLPHNLSSPHAMKEFHALRNLSDVWEQTKDFEFILRIIRAATFDGYEGAYFYDKDGHKIEIRGAFRVIE